MKLVTFAIAGCLACRYDYIPVRPARTVCNSSAVGSSSLGYIVVTGSRSCYELPADRCSPDHPDYENDVQSGFCEHVERHNEQVQHRQIRDGVLAGVAVVVVTVLVVVAFPR